MGRWVSKWGFQVGILLLGPGFAGANLSEVKTYSPDTWDFDLIGQYFYTNANYSGSYSPTTTLPSGNSLTWAAADALVRHSFERSKWAVTAGGQYAQTTAKNSSGSISNSGLSEASIGTDFVLLDGSLFALIPEFSITLPATNVDFTETNTPAINEGVTTITGLMRAQLQWKSLTFGGFGGYTNRGNGRSSLIPYGGYAQWQFTGWNIGGKLTGSASLSNDQDTNNYLYRNNWQNSADAGSELFGAVNPSVLAATAWVEIGLSQSFAFSLGAGTTLTGANAASGSNFAGALSYRSEPNAKHRTSPVEPEFEIPRDAVVRPRKKTTPAPAPSPAPTAQPAPPSDSKQNQLDQNDMKLEIKKQKYQPYDPYHE